LVQVITRSGGTITPRLAAKAMASLRVPGAAERALQILVGTGAGSWKYKLCGRRGGRQSKVLVLTDPGKFGTRIRQTVSARNYNTPEDSHRLIATLVKWTNQYPQVPCSKFADVFDRAAELMTYLAPSDLSESGMERNLRLQPNGDLSAEWRSSGPSP